MSILDSLSHFGVSDFTESAVGVDTVLVTKFDIEFGDVADPDVGVPRK